jgi:outer membrane receptor protein involved in Fe transport
VRRDDVEARGQRTAACCGRGAFGTDPRSGILADIDNDGAIDFWEARGVAVANNFATVNLVDYDADNTAFSIGGTFLVNDSSSVFARYSEGGRAVADRLLQIGGALNPDGSLSRTTDGFDDVEQLEVGYKLRGGDYAFYATFFDTTTEETNAEITSGLTFEREYEARGLELEGSVDIAGFGLSGNLTWTDAEISADRTNPALVGNTPRRQADFIWTITPAYRADRWSVGATLQGSTEYFTQDNNQLKQDAYNILHLFGSYRITDALTVSFNVNNATDEFVVTEVEEGAGAPGTIVRGRPLSGRSSAISLRYEF